MRRKLRRILCSQSPVPSRPLQKLCLPQRNESQRCSPTSTGGDSSRTSVVQGVRQYLNQHSLVYQRSEAEGLSRAPWSRRGHGCRRRERRRTPFLEPRPHSIRQALNNLLCDSEVERLHAVQFLLGHFYLWNDHQNLNIFTEYCFNRAALALERDNKMNRSMMGHYQRLSQKILGGGFRRGSIDFGVGFYHRNGFVWGGGLNPEPLNTPMDIK